MNGSGSPMLSWRSAVSIFRPISCPGRRVSKRKRMGNDDLSVEVKVEPHTEVARVLLATLPTAPDVCMARANCVRLTFALQICSVRFRILSIEIADLPAFDLD